MEIYAEISTKLADLIRKGYVLAIPDGVEVQQLNKKAYLFNCDESNKEDMIELLDVNGIAWQDNKSDEDVRNDIKLAKKEAKEIKRKKKIKDYAKEYLSQMGRGY